MTGKYAVMPKDVIPTKLNPNKVGADVANYVCAKAGKQLVIP